ncbi:MAG: hypothetical protein GPJ25_20850 [Microcystis aeruginosa LE13-04]|nr:hypothetical protein [Microcystis aeruginosa LE13-04]
MSVGTLIEFYFKLIICIAITEEPNLLISPLNPDCESHFAFNYDGTIKPVQEDDQKAINTIEKLGLNLNQIKALRKAAIEPFLDEEIDNAQLKVFVNGYLCLDAQQRYGVLLNNFSFTKIQKLL